MENNKWYWVKIGGEWSPAIRDKNACGGWTNLDTWEDWGNEVEEFIEIPTPETIKESCNCVQYKSGSTAHHKGGWICPIHGQCF